MESEEALNYYIDEVKDTNNEIEIEEEQVPNGRIIRSELWVILYFVNCRSRTGG
jgi:hypothetical protein